MPGLKVCRRSEIRSLSPDGGATPVGATPVEVVIDARSDHIDILTDRVGAEYAAGRDASQNACRCRGDGTVTHEKVIVLDPNRPIRCESVFEARSDDTTPARFIRRIEQRACGGHRAPGLFGRHRPAPPPKTKNIVPTLAALTRETPKTPALGNVCATETKNPQIELTQISPC